jgi:hypothetical protein
MFVEIQVSIVRIEDLIEMNFIFLLGFYYSPLHLKTMSQGWAETAAVMMIV